MSPDTPTPLREGKGKEGRGGLLKKYTAERRKKVDSHPVGFVPSASARPLVPIPHIRLTYTLREIERKRDRVVEKKERKTRGSGEGEGERAIAKLDLSAPSERERKTPQTEKEDCEMGTFGVV